MCPNAATYHKLLKERELRHKMGNGDDYELVLGEQLKHLDEEVCGP